MSHSHVISGLSSIVNPDNVRKDMDIKELERQLISGGMIGRKTKDIDDKCREEMQEVANLLGVPFGDVRPSGGESPRSSMGSFAGTPLSAGSAASSAPQSMAPSVDNSDDEDSDDEASGDDSDDEGSAPTYVFGSALQSKTEEQRRLSHINSVMGQSETSGGFSLEKEKRADMKCAMLAEIDSLISSLEDADIDLSRMHKVDGNSSYEDVETVLNILRHKQDHTRYCSFAEEVLLFGAYGMEELFDGKKQWFGYSPDLSDWHKTVNMKMRRIRCDLSNVVSAGMSSYNVGPITRILLELIPSMFIYSKMRKQQHSQPNLYDDASMAGVNDRIRGN